MKNRYDKNPHVLFFTGGNGYKKYDEATKLLGLNIHFIVPISDQGGTIGKVKSVLGGRGLGDIKSRLVNLADTSTKENKAIKRLLSLRLNQRNRKKALNQWQSILKNIDNGREPLWVPITDKYKKKIFITGFNAFNEATNRVPNFDHRDGSIGLYFLKGLEVNFNSIDLAIKEFGKVIQLPSNITVIPIIKENKDITIAAKLMSDKVIYGQNQISHPGRLINKEYDSSLEAPIQKIFYIDSWKQKYQPQANPGVIKLIEKANNIIYTMGSLYTSLVPLLIIKGIGEKIETKKCKKILLLNGFPDRETDGMEALDYLEALKQAANRYGELNNPIIKYVTHLFVCSNTPIKVSQQAIKDLGIKIKYIHSHSKNGKAMYDTQDLIKNYSSLINN